MNTLIIFDCFGVIFGEVAPLFLRKFLPRQQADELKEKLFVPADLGLVTYDELMDNMAEALKMDKTEMLRQWEELFIIKNDTLEVIKSLQGKADLALLSNAPLGVVEGLFEKHGLDKYFSHKVISCNIKMAKPDLEIYKHCISLFNKVYDKIYMIDDNQGNLRELPSIGITPVLFRNAEDISFLAEECE